MTVDSIHQLLISMSPSGSDWAAVSVELLSEVFTLVSLKTKMLCESVCETWRSTLRDEPEQGLWGNLVCCSECNSGCLLCVHFCTKPSKFIYSSILFQFTVVLDACKVSNPSHFHVPSGVVPKLDTPADNRGNRRKQPGDQPSTFVQSLCSAGWLAFSETQGHATGGPRLSPRTLRPGQLSRRQWHLLCYLSGFVTHDR